MTTRALRVDPFFPSRLRYGSKQIATDPVFLEKCEEEKEEEERVAVDVSNEQSALDKLVEPVTTQSGFPKMVDIRPSGSQRESRAVHHFAQKIIENNYTLKDRGKIVDVLSKAMCTSLHKDSQSVLQNIVDMHLSLFNESKTKEEVCKSIANTLGNEPFAIETITFDEYNEISRGQINFTLRLDEGKKKWTAVAKEGALATWVSELGAFTKQLFNPLTGFIVSCTRTYVNRLVERANDMRLRMVASRSSSAAATNVARITLGRYENSVRNLKQVNYHEGNHNHHQIAWTTMEEDMLSTDDLERTSVQTFPKLSGRTCKNDTLPTAAEIELAVKSESIDQLSVFQVVASIVYIMSHGLNPFADAEGFVDRLKQKVLQLDHRLENAPLNEKNNFVFEDLIDRLKKYAAA